MAGHVSWNNPLGMKIFSRKYHLHRIALILALGTLSFVLVRARTRIDQEPEITFKAAPELVGLGWINAGHPIKLASRRGKVTLVDFWTYACTNCQANLPAYEQWQKDFSGAGFTVLGVHTPELPQEYKPAFVKKFVAEHGITYPVLLDNDYKNWSLWKQEYWPAVYLIDKKGEIREVWLGELGTDGRKKVERKIRELLAEPY
jgi:peroxiredoxin